MALNTNRVISGTYGSLWIEGEFVSEVKRFEARVEINKEDIPIVGRFMQGSKAMGAKGTGSVTLHKVGSRMARIISDSLKQGINPEIEILSELNDPASHGAERVLVKEITFDDLTLASWEAGAVGEIECPFTFGDWKFVDTIEEE